MLTKTDCATIVNRLHATCTLPTAAEFQDRNCHICHEDTLVTNGSEVPVKLVCGHVFGMSCLMEWTLNQIEAGRAIVKCPLCRIAFLSAPQEASRATASRRDLQLSGVQTLSEDWFRQAERLWDICCSDVLEALEIFPVGETAQENLEAIDEFFAKDIPAAESFLSFGSAYNFACSQLPHRPDIERRDFTTACSHYYNRLTFLDLLQHLVTGTGSLEEWRRFQVSQRSTRQLAENLRRMDHSRLKLAERVLQSMEARTGLHLSE